MVHYNRSHFFRTVVFVMTVLCFSSVFMRVAEAQNLVTQNAFVSAQVQGNNGLITLWKGSPPPVSNSALSYPGTSYLSVEANGVFFTNNTNVGATSKPPATNLSFPETAKISDTIRTVWSEDGFDIIQNVFPVTFTSSGVIVISVGIVNHTTSSFPVQAQFLLDIENSDADSANDAPFIVEGFSIVTNWQSCPPSPIPNSFLTFQDPPKLVNTGTDGIGYCNDSATPQPIGLLPLSVLQFGDYPEQVFTTFGAATPSPSIRDGAALLMGQPMSANPFIAGSSDSVTEIMRTAYGTPPASSNSIVNILSSGAAQDQVSVFPNPLTASATFSYSLDARSTVTISIFDMLGREVARPISDEAQEAGSNQVTFDARSLTPGVYTCVLAANGEERTVSMVVTR